MLRMFSFAIIAAIAMLWGPAAAVAGPNDYVFEPVKAQIKQGDDWLSQQVPAILHSHAYHQGGALFVTWDEAEIGDGPIGMIVLSPFAKGNGYQNFIYYEHGSTLRTMEEIFGVSPLLGDAAGQSDLRDLFAVFP